MKHLVTLLIDTQSKQEMGSMVVELEDLPGTKVLGIAEVPETGKPCVSIPFHEGNV